MQVPDAASTGTNVFGALALLDAMRAEGKRGSIVTLICDPGERYLDTCYDPDWGRRRASTRRRSAPGWRGSRRLGEDQAPSGGASSSKAASALAPYIIDGPPPM